MKTAPADQVITEEIAINAPADQVFAALTDPTCRMQWWGAEGRFKTTQMESDLRVGGRWMMAGSGMGGKPFRISGEYRAVECPRLLVFTWLPDFYPDAEVSLVRFDLEESDGITRVRLTHSELTSRDARVHRGWPDILVWLRDYVEARR
jgi:uncharacterized protein YndB with AHSA1/START domain